MSRSSDWAVLLLNDSARILLDYKSPLAAEIRKQIESDGDSKISDLHVWKIADNNYAFILCPFFVPNITTTACPAYGTAPLQRHVQAKSGVIRPDRRWYGILSEYGHRPGLRDPVW